MRNHSIAVISGITTPLPMPICHQYWRQVETTLSCSEAVAPGSPPNLVHIPTTRTNLLRQKQWVLGLLSAVHETISVGGSLGSCVLTRYITTKKPILPRQCLSRFQCQFFGTMRSCSLWSSRSALLTSKLTRLALFNPRVLKFYPVQGGVSLLGNGRVVHGTFGCGGEYGFAYRL